MAKRALQDSVRAHTYIGDHRARYQRTLARYQQGVGGATVGQSNQGPTREQRAILGEESGDH